MLFQNYREIRGLSVCDGIGVPARPQVKLGQFVQTLHLVVSELEVHYLEVLGYSVFGLRFWQDDEVVLEAPS
jgi:hypothetical protein